MLRILSRNPQFIDSLKNFKNVYVVGEKFLSISVFVIILVILAGYFSIVYLSFNGFLYDSGDTAVAEQALWNTIHGHWFYQSFLGVSNNFREHLYFSQIVFLPFYAVAPHTFTLYAVIHLMFGISSVFLFYFTKEKIGSLAAVIISVFFLLQPITVWQNIGPLHVVAVAAPLLLITLIFYEKRRYSLWLIFMLLTTMTGEFISPTIFLLGLISWLDRRSLKWILPPMISGAIMYIGSIFYITIGFATSKHIFQSLQISEITNNNFLKRLSLLEDFFRPALYLLPLFSKYGILLVPTIVLCLLIVDSSRFWTGSHVFSPMPVIITLAILDVLQRCNMKWRNIVCACLILGLLISLPIWTKRVKLKPDINASEMREAISLVKDKGSVTSSRVMSYHLSHRHDFYLIDNEKFTDYVLFHMEKYEAKDDRFKPYIESIMASDEYVKVMDKNPIVVLIKRIKLAQLLNMAIEEIPNKPEEVSRLLKNKGKTPF